MPQPAGTANLLQAADTPLGLIHIQKREMGLVSVGKAASHIVFITCLLSKAIVEIYE